MKEDVGGGFVVEKKKKKIFFFFLGVNIKAKKIKTTPLPWEGKKKPKKGLFFCLWESRHAQYFRHHPFQC